MIGACPICGCRDYVSVWRSESPILPIVSVSRPSFADLFSDIDIAICSACGHVFNCAFEPDAVGTMYGDVALTNIPVDPSMNKRLEDLAAWLPPEIVENRNVVEIGAGGGHLARLLARTARQVLVIEPCRALTKDMLPERNIHLIHDLFPTPESTERADLLVARQVLEHVPEPLSFLNAVSAALNDGGYAYIEVPGSEYIERHGALLDLHAQHVHYFDEPTLTGLADSVGLSMVRSHLIKDGHDFGILFKRTRSREVEGRPRKPEHSKIARWQNVLQRQYNALDRFDIERLGKVALYGATMHGTVFLNHLKQKDDSRIAAVFDDNPGYGNLGLYTAKRAVPTVMPSTDSVGQFNTIIITAYLHDVAIARKLRSLDYQGQVFSVRPQHDASELDDVRLVFNDNIGR